MKTIGMDADKIVKIIVNIPTQDALIFGGIATLVVGIVAIKIKDEIDKKVGEINRIHDRLDTYLRWKGII